MDLEEQGLVSGSSRMRMRKVKQSRDAWRAGTLELIAPLVVLSLLSIGVLCYNLFKQQEPCADTAQKFAKHFYCYNASASPGVHVDGA